jgi:hypothetical protein
MSNRKRQTAGKQRPKSEQQAEQHRIELSRYLTRRGPGDEEHAPTPQRIERAEEAGEMIRANVIYTERGLPTGHFYWQITPVIDDLKRRGTLEPEEYDAAFRFMRHWHNGIHRGPATSRIAPRCDGEVNDMTPDERRWHYSGMAKNAFKSVNHKFQPALAWLIRAMGDPVPLKVLGAYYAPDKGAQTQTSQGALALRLACAELCEYYGIDHALSRKRIEQLSEVLLAQITLSSVK